jgi:hypothetical protein
LGSPDVYVEIDKDGKNIAKLFIYSDRVFVQMADSDVITHWTFITKQEHDNLLRALGLKSG